MAYVPTKAGVENGVEILATAQDAAVSLQEEIQPASTRSDLVDEAVPAPNAQDLAPTIGLPSRLLIPKINVDAKIEHLGLTSGGAVMAPAGGRDTSWFTGGVRPGQNGSALISGHYGIWQDSTNSVFNFLHTLKPGDLVQVRDENGNLISFKVKSMRVYDKEDKVPELFEKSGEPRMNIITCHGTWLPGEQTYNQRLVVFTELVN